MEFLPETNPHYLLVHNGAEISSWFCVMRPLVALRILLCSPKILMTVSSKFICVSMKITNKMHYIDKFIITSQLYMFRAMFSSIIRRT